MKPLSELLPKTMLSLEASEPLSNILSEEEKQGAIDWAIECEMKRYAFSLADKGASKQLIEQKIASRNWLEHIDAEKVIEQANKRKHWAEIEAKERAERKQTQLKAMEELIARHNANYFFNVIKRYFYQNYGRFLHNETNEHYVKAVCFFFAGDERFETELGYSFRKGLLIVGDAGLGKTRTIEAIKNNELRPVTIYSMITISDKVREHGHLEINTNKFLLLDDVGSEQETVNYYGTKINWFKDFIETYYLNNLFYNRLLITTNCGGEALEQKYGYRVRSRLREMFNVIELRGEDLRK